jgi:hypothetical protein
MRVLDGREQVTLSRLLLKLRKGDVVKVVREIRMYDDEDWKRVVIRVLVVVKNRGAILDRPSQN